MQAFSGRVQNFRCTLTYHNLLFCRLPLNSVLGFIIQRTYKKSRFRWVKVGLGLRLKSDEHKHGQVSRHRLIRSWGQYSVSHALHSQAGLAT